jgi:hypothetical protein
VCILFDLVSIKFNVIELNLFTPFEHPISEQEVVNCKVCAVRFFYYPKRCTLLLLLLLLLFIKACPITLGSSTHRVILVVYQEVSFTVSLHCSELPHPALL